MIAILIADVKGFSRLMGEDEAWAVQNLNAFKAILAVHIREQKGPPLRGRGGQVPGGISQCGGRSPVRRGDSAGTEDSECPVSRWQEDGISHGG